LTWVSKSTGRSEYIVPVDPNDHLPGEKARHSGEYEEWNVRGGPTGLSVYAKQSATLPSLPSGFIWRFVTRETESAADRDKTLR
jgi:hypothetical protein